MYTSACVSFRRQQRQSRGITFLDARRGPIDDDERFYDYVVGAGARFRDAIKRSLESNREYPLTAAADYLSDLGWERGHAALDVAQLGSVTAASDRDCCDFLPELTPASGTSALPLDYIAPWCFLNPQVQFAEPPPRVQSPSLAIVYSENSQGFDFAAVAKQIATSMRTQLRCNTFRGKEFSCSPETRYDLLVKVFRNHRAVLFLGHQQPATENREGGWLLSDDFTLTAAELQGILGAHSTPAHSVDRRVPVPEVVFVNACASAGQTAVRGETAGLTYPDLFLNAGVRFFIGTSMKVYFPQDKRQAGLEATGDLAIRFFWNWALNNDGAVLHLYESKYPREGSTRTFSLLTSLYRIYGSEGLAVEHQSRQGARQSPAGPTILGVNSGDQVGEYILKDELWQNRLSRTFAARHKDTNGFHLVQILTDQVKVAEDLVPRLEGALARLQECTLERAGLHLIPQRHQLVSITRDNRALEQAHVLIYDRPHDNEHSLGAWPTVPVNEAGYTQLLAQSVELAAAVQQLHSNGLAHGNLVADNIVACHFHEQQRLMLKDAWMHLAGIADVGGDATRSQEVDQQLDCHSLATILYQWITGHSPVNEEQPLDASPRTFAEHLGDRAAAVPAVFEPLIRECLVGDPALRPPIEHVLKRLQWAAIAGGGYVGDLEVELHQSIQAGHRLFAIWADDQQEVRDTIYALAAHVHPQLRPIATAISSMRYQLFVAEEYEGLYERVSSGGVQRRIEHVPWQTQHQLIRSGMSPLQITPQLERREAARSIWTWLRQLYHRRQRTADTSEPVPIVLLCGNDWWDIGPDLWRLLRQFQEEPEFAPVVIVTDDVIDLEKELSLLFVSLQHPVPPPAALFETLHAETARDPRLNRTSAAESALHLARELYPISAREVQQAVRLSSLRYNVVDNRLLEIRDEERGRRFQALHTATYIPYSKLPPLPWIGLPDDVWQRLYPWLLSLSAGAPVMREIPAPRRLLLAGESGCGKTWLAQVIANWTRRPMIRLNAASCLSGGLGDSERALRRTLREVNGLHRCLVLLDNLDRLFDFSDDPAQAQVAEPTLMRMSAIIRQWLDELPASVVAVATMRNAEQLPPEWLNRLELRLKLPELDGPTGIYRKRVLAANLFRFRLPELADDDDLLARLGQGTADPLLLSPMGRLHPRLFSSQRAALRTGAEVKAWIEQTIALHDGRPHSATSAEFWLEAVSLPSI